MQRVIVNLQSYVMSDAIKMALTTNGDFTVAVVDKPDKVLNKTYNFAATIVIMEVTAYTPFKLEERLKLKEQIRKKCPDTKIVLLVDENAQGDVAEKVKQAKVDGQIDQFIYGSISASYLVALLETV